MGIVRYGLILLVLFLAGCCPKFLPKEEWEMSQSERLYYAYCAGELWREIGGSQPGFAIYGGGPHSYPPMQPAEWHKGPGMK